MDFQKSDFEALKFNPFPLPIETNILEAFAELSRYKEFSEAITDVEGNPSSLDRNKVLRFIIYTYDKRSPLLSEKNLVKRKMLACKIAGFELIPYKPTVGGQPLEIPPPKYSTEVEMMIKGYNKVVNSMICRYCRNQKDLMYSLMIAGMESFFDNISKLSTPMTGEDDMKELNNRAVLFNHTTSMIAKIESNADDIFQGDIPLMYEADIIDQQEKGAILSFPEKIASMREEGILEKELKKADK